jgi:hypothetical protein
VEKSIFPTLLAKLWSKLEPSLSTSGFAGAGLFPLDASKPLRKLLPIQCQSPSSKSIQELSPHHKLRKAIEMALFPICTPANKLAIEGDRKRKRTTCGEELTANEALGYLKDRQQARDQKLKENPKVTHKVCPKKPAKKLTDVDTATAKTSFKNQLQDYRTNDKYEPEIHRRALEKRCLLHNIDILESKADGSCLFHSLQQLTGRKSSILRSEAVDWLEDNVVTLFL